MGADCIGYILIGPIELDKRKVKAAGNYLLEMRCRAQRLLDENKLDTDVEKRFDLDLGAMGRDDPEDQLRYIVETATVELLKNFVDWWNDGGWRDTGVRVHKGKKIMAALEMSWGDGPSEGSSAELCERVCSCGLLDRLGIE